MQEDTVQPQDPAKTRLLRRWMFVTAALILLAYLFTFVLRARGAASAHRTVNSVYEAVKAGDYGALEREQLSSASAMLTLQEAEKRHGKLEGWKELSSSTHLLGRPTQIETLVQRGGKQYVEVLALGDSVHLHIVMELEEADWKAGRYDRAIRIVAKR